MLYKVWDDLFGRSKRGKPLADPVVDEILDDDFIVPFILPHRCRMVLQRMSILPPLPLR